MGRSNKYLERATPFDYYYSCMKRRVKYDRKWDFTLTINDLKEQWEKQRGFCALSGVELTLPSLEWAGKNKKTLIRGNASLDRKDSTKPYCKENIQWLLHIVNVMKLNQTTDDFVNLCKVIVNHNRSI